MSFRRYDHYRDSGVEWLGEVPDYWRISPLLSVASECDRPNVGMIESNLLSLSYGRIVRKDINDNDGLLPESFETYQIIEPDDVVWRLTDLQNDKRSLRTALASERGIITSAYLATHPLRIEAGFVAYLLRAYDLQKVFYSMGGGLRQGMKFSDVKRLPILVPPPDEQSAIAAFLDRETGKIDALVEEQRRLIALLKEKRQAVISHAVTKGLDPSAPMKPSGVDWLGDVPAHWTKRPLKSITTIRYGIGEPPPYQESGTPLIRATNVDAGNIRQSGMVFVDPGDIPKKRIVWLEEGDVIVVRSGAYTGDSAIITSRDTPAIAGFDMVVRTRGCVSMFLQFVLLSRYMKEFQIDLERTRAAQPHLNAEELGSCFVLAPPPEEQQQIVGSLQRQTRGIDDLTAQAEDAITLLQERRAALISAAVTGKIDVRGEVLEMEAA